MAEWWLDCENCRYLTVVGLHDTGPRNDIMCRCDASSFSRISAHATSLARK